MNDFLPAGTVLDSGKKHYTIVKMLGKGGFGITYQATSTVSDGNISFEVPYAVKEHYISSMNHREGTTVVVSNPNNRQEVADSLDNFLTEAQRLNKLSLTHSNIVRVNESFRANDTAYYVMEYVAGQSLRDFVKSQPDRRLPEQQAVGIIRAVAEAVAFLHDNRMTHLDIKPDNIILRDAATPVLIDFGLSKHFDKTGRPTSTIRMTGCSAGYSPMEQYVGITEFTPEADIYALAATLLYCLTGKEPALSSSINIGAVCDGLRESVSAPVVDALRQAMAKLKEDRTHDVRTFAAALGGSEGVKHASRIPSPKPTERSTQIIGRRGSQRHADGGSSGSSDHSRSSDNAGSTPITTNRRRLYMALAGGVAVVVLLCVLLFAGGKGGSKAQGTLAQAIEAGHIENGYLYIDKNYGLLVSDSVVPVYDGDDSFYLRYTGGINSDGQPSGEGTAENLDGNGNSLGISIKGTWEVKPEEGQYLAEGSTLSYHPADKDRTLWFDLTGKFQGFEGKGGKMVFGDGSVFEGTCDDSMPRDGKMTYPDGSYFIGEFTGDIGSAPEIVSGQFYDASDNKAGDPITAQ